MSTITKTLTLEAGKQYRLTDVKRHPFNPEASITEPFTVVKSGINGAYVRFGSDPFTQYFGQHNLDKGYFSMVPATAKKQPVHPSKLSRQCRIILRHLQTNAITQRTALMDHGVMALPRRIADLKEAGYQIESVMKKHPVTGQRYASYYLAA